MSKVYRIDDAEIGVAKAMDLRDTLIEMRNHALTAGAMDWAVALSYIIGLFNRFGHETWPGEWVNVTPA